MEYYPFNNAILNNVWSSDFSIIILKLTYNAGQMISINSLRYSIPGSKI